MTDPTQQVILGKIPRCGVSPMKRFSVGKILDGTVPTYFAPGEDGSYVNRCKFFETFLGPNPYVPPTEWKNAKQLLRLPKVVNFLYATQSIGVLRVLTHWLPVGKAIASKYEDHSEGVYGIANDQGYGSLRSPRGSSITPGWLQYLTPRSEHLGDGFLGTDLLNIVIYQDLGLGASQYDFLPLLNEIPGLTWVSTQNVALAKKRFAADKAALVDAYSAKNFARTATFIYYDTDKVPANKVVNAPFDNIEQTNFTFIVNKDNPQFLETEYNNFPYFFKNPPNVGMSAFNVLVTAIDLWDASEQWQIGWLKELCGGLEDVGFQYKGGLSFKSNPTDQIDNDIREHFGLKTGG